MAIRDYINRKTVFNIFLIYLGSVLLASYRFGAAEENASVVAIVERDLALFSQALAAIPLMFLPLFTAASSDQLPKSDQEQLTDMINNMYRDNLQVATRKHWRKQIPGEGSILNPMFFWGRAPGTDMMALVSLCPNGDEEMHLIPRKEFNQKPADHRDIYSPSLPYQYVSRRHVDQNGRLIPSKRLPLFNMPTIKTGVPCQGSTEKFKPALPGDIHFLKEVVTERLNFGEYVSKNPVFGLNYNRWLQDVDDPEAIAHFEVELAENDAAKRVLFVNFCPDGTEMTHFIQRDAIFREKGSPNSVKLLEPHALLTRSHGAFDGEKFLPYPLEKLPEYTVSMTDKAEPCAGHESSLFAKDDGKISKDKGNDNLLYGKSPRFSVRQ